MKTTNKNVLIEENLHQKLKLEAFSRRKTIKAYLEELLKEHLKSVREASPQ